MELLTHTCSLGAAPDPKMPLTKQILAEYAHELNDNLLDFDYECPTNLAMLDAWYQACHENYLFVPPSFFASPAHQLLDRFSEKALTCSLPLYRGMLTLVIYPEDPDMVEDRDFVAECEWDIEWGEPQREPETIAFLPFSDGELWKNKAPLIMF